MTDLTAWMMQVNRTSRFGDGCSAAGGAEAARAAGGVERLHEATTRSERTTVTKTRRVQTRTSGVRADLPLRINVTLSKVLDAGDRLLVHDKTVFFQESVRDGLPCLECAVGKGLAVVT